MLRLLVSLVIRLRRSFGRITLAFQAQFTSLWRLILRFACRRGRSQIWRHVNDVPIPASHPTGERAQASGGAEADDESAGTLAARPVRRPARWEDELSTYQDPASHLRPIPATPEGASQRYKPRKALSQINRFSEIPAGQRKLLSALPGAPEGWKRHVHPEGNVLFYHEGLRIFTEANVTQHGRDIILCAIDLIRQATKNNDVILDELTEIVLNVDEDGTWHYYFVDHKNRLLFWLHRMLPQEDLGTELQGTTGYSHIKYLVEARYWYGFSGSFRGMITVYDVDCRSHCEYYPHNRRIPTRVFEELRGMLNCAKTDMMTADSSTSPFAQDELVAILDLVNSLKSDEEIADSNSIWAIARLMSFFTENQFLNFCGQECARLDADTPLFGEDTWNRSKVFKVANAVLFWSLNEHATRLQRIWVDGIIIQPRWKAFINRLTSELTRYTIFSTVMLTVNFSFLAVPGVVDTSKPAGPIQIIIYCSVVLTIGSIVFSFALLNVYNDPRLMDASPAVAAMRTLAQKKLGMARFAITHCLPYACLIWSIILFAVALAVQIFLPKELSTLVTLGVVGLILLLFGVMGIRIMRLFSLDEVEEADASAQDRLQRGIKWGREMYRTFCHC